MTNAQRTSFSLDGPSISLDERTHAVRGDLADLALAGQLFVPHYARPMAMRCINESAQVHAEADGATEVRAVLAKDEYFMVVDLSGGWAWGFRAEDHVVGYVPTDVLEQVK